MSFLRAVFVAAITFSTVLASAETPCNLVVDSKGTPIRAKAPLSFYIQAGMPLDYMDSIIMAASIWNKEAKRMVIAIEDGEARLDAGQDGRNVIALDKSKNFDPSEHAVVSVYFNDDGIINEADIRLNSDRKFGTDDSPSKVHLTTLMVQQFGHALGFRTSEEKISVMRPTQATGEMRSELTFKDIANLRCAYTK